MTANEKDEGSPFWLLLIRPSTFWRQRFRRWVSRRMPPARSLRLDRFRLFVFPSLYGLAFLLVCMLIWLLGTNYGNNLALGLTYLLVSLFIVSILHTFNNLSGVTVTALSAKTAFAGEDVEFELLLSKDSDKHYENIQVSWPGGSVATVDLLDNSEQRIKLFVPSDRRGWLNPGRLLVETYYPLGLIRTWTWLDLDIEALIYPAPVYAGSPPLNRASTLEGSELSDEGSEDFSGFKAYQPGYSLRHVAWKQYARGQGLYLKNYCDYLSPTSWLSWDDLSGFTREERLSRLCYWVLELAKTASDYGLALPGQKLNPGQGLKHKTTLLKALALFGEEASS